MDESHRTPQIRTLPPSVFSEVLQRKEAVVKDIGVWMSRGVLEHKRQNDVAVQVWNLRRLPDGFAEAFIAGRLFVAVDGHWRGFFRLAAPILCNAADPACPYAVAFDPNSWTAIFPQRAPTRDRRTGYTLDLPTADMVKPTAPPDSTRGETSQKNETQELMALLEREEERE
jgi:hypothetical protein